MLRAETHGFSSSVMKGTKCPHPLPSLDDTHRSHGPDPHPAVRPLPIPRGFDRRHRDMESVDALIKGIKEYRGGVVLVSHDARLISSTGCELWVCEGKGKVRRGRSSARRQHSRVTQPAGAP